MDDEVKKITLGLIKYLKIRKQLNLLPEIVQNLEKQAQRLAPENTALVTTAFKLSSTERKLIKSHLESLFGKKLSLRIHVDPNILSGIVVRIADTVIDLSMAKELGEMAKKLKD